MNHICTWLCADKKGEESLFPQSGQKSSSQAHQNIYWRCLIVFFITSKRFNRNEKHVLFTNVQHLPKIDGRSVRDILADLEVEIIHTDFKYKTPKGYYGLFQNQFYEFSILEHISQNNPNADHKYLILDSDCVFIKPAQRLFAEAEKNGFISFEIDSPVNYDINGLSRLEMKTLFEELLEKPVNDIPSYHLGEFLLCSVENIKKIFADFQELWPKLLERHALGLKKLNEEAHTLSYLYYKNGLHASQDNSFIKRIWTNPLFYRNVKPEDVDLTIWHLPAEKTYGIAGMYNYLINECKDYGQDMPSTEFVERLKDFAGIPALPVVRQFNYYTTSCYKAIIKKIKNVNFKLRPVG
ncbi:hypothetical protein [Desertivirga xinjiangensis]|uniref:hypothetical protein n=1 Tax=Desertivirga xinjiangensis TaxID=539206 RepID=UPI00210DB600|nr:hypothetical protein [Pedobacter xinjiangensis]